jgi:hypothetical protein
MTDAFISANDGLLYRKTEDRWDKKWEVVNLPVLDECREVIEGLLGALEANVPYSLEVPPHAYEAGFCNDPIIARAEALLTKLRRAAGDKQEV